ASVGGLLGFKTDEPRMKESLSIDAQRNIHVEFVEDDTEVDHPNTPRIMIGRRREQLQLVAISITDGKESITVLNGFELRLSGNHPDVLIVHNDRYGAIASVTDIFAKHEINIGHMEVNRKDVNQEALMVIEVDQNVNDTILEELNKAAHIIRISKIDG